MARTGLARRSSSASGFLGLIPVMLRRLRNETALVGTLFAVVLVTSLLLTGAPRWFNRVSDQGIQHAVRQAGAINRNISFSIGESIPAGSEEAGIFTGVMQRGTEIRQGLPQSVQSIIQRQRFLVDSQQFAVSEPPGQPAAPFDRFFTFRYQEGIENHIELVDGHMPRPRDPVTYTFNEETGKQQIPLYEVAISQETADLLSAQLGDRIILRPDRNSRLTRDIPRSQLDYRLAVEISGIIEPDDPDLEYWLSDLRLHRPTVQQTPDVTIIFATGLMAPADYPRLDDDTGDALFSYNWRFFTNPERFDAGMATDLTGDIRNLDVTYGSSILNPVNELSVRTGLVAILTDFARQQQFTVSVLALATIGIIAVSLAVVALMAMLIAERRREETLLIRGRGASSGQLLMSRLTEGLVIALPATLLGYLAAIMVIDARPSNWSIWAFAGITLATAVVLAGAALPLIRRDLGRLYSEHDVPRGTSPKRIVLEFGVVALAIAAIILLQRRGLATGSTAKADRGFDPLLATVPVLLGLAVGIVTLRIFPYAIRLLAWLASIRRDLVLFVGFRRILQQRAAARLPILIILLAVGIAVFSAVIQRSIAEGQREAVWQRVGADYRVESTREDASLPGRVDLSGVDGVEATAVGHIDDDVRVSQEAFSFINTTLLALDTGAYADVTAGTRAEPDFPDVLVSEQITQGIGTESNPIPAVVSSRLGAELTLGQGDTLTLSFGPRDEFVFIVRDIPDRFPGLAADSPFVVTPLDSLRAANQEDELRPTDIFIQAGRGNGAELAETLRSQTLSARLVSRYDLYDEIHDAPLVAGVVTGFRLTLILAAIYAGLAAIAALALTARARSRDLGYLRTLGLSSRQAIGVTVVEQLPPVVAAAAAGAALGMGIARLVEPGVDLNALTGPGLPASLRFDWLALAVLAGGLALTITIAIAIYSTVARKRSLGDVLRLGDNE